MLKFSSRVLDFSIFILRQNKLVCAQMASKKSQGLSHFESTFWRYAGLLAGIHYRGKDLSFFSSPSFLPMTFVYICSENALHISGFYFMQLATYERRVLDSLCSPLIHCRMQSKRTDYCKVRTEVLNLFPGENSAQISWNPWVLPLFNIPNVMTRHFFDGRQGDKQQFLSQI